MEFGPVHKSALSAWRASCEQQDPMFVGLERDLQVLPLGEWHALPGESLSSDSEESKTWDWLEETFDPDDTVDLHHSKHEGTYIDADLFLTEVGHLAIRVSCSDGGSSTAATFLVRRIEPRSE